MGKNLIQQARGKGGPRYRAPSFNYKGKAEHKKFSQNASEGIITDIIHCAGHSAPLIEIKYNDGEEILNIAPEGVKIGDTVSCNAQDPSIAGTMMLRNIPEGTLIYNIESQPGDGGKFARASGTFGRVLSRMENKVMIMLPSKKQKEFNPACRACIGVVAGGGRPEKPILKAGNAWFKATSRNKIWPIVAGQSQNAVDHPFGTSRSSKKGHPTIAPKNAPPGKNVGMIRPSRTGRKKR